MASVWKDSASGMKGERALPAGVVAVQRSYQVGVLMDKRQQCSDDMDKSQLRANMEHLARRKVGRQLSDGAAPLESLRNRKTKDG